MYVENNGVGRATTVLLIFKDIWKQATIIFKIFYVFNNLSIFYLSIHLFTYLFIYLFICLFMYLFIYLFIYSFIHFVILSITFYIIDLKYEP